jgi:hypothetical protein
MIDDIVAGIAIELGQKNANRMLARSLKRSSVYESFLEVIDLEDDCSRNTRRLSERLKNGGPNIHPYELERGFRSAVFDLLQEEHQVLGIKAFRATLINVIEACRHPTEYHQALVERTLDFLNALLRDDSYMRGQKSLSDSSDAAPGTGTGDGQRSIKGLEKIGAAAIIAYYSRILQMVLNDLEADIGTKADALFEKVLQRSEYYDRFLSQFQVRGDIQKNVNRIRDHISKAGFRLGKNSFIAGFQNILTDLLEEEKMLLGEKSTQSTILRIENFVSEISQPEYRPLGMDLIVTLKRLI